MANRETGYVSFKAQSQNWKLRFTTNALCELEDESGMSAIAFANSMNDEANISIKSMRLMLWAGLIDNHEDISQKICGVLIDEIGMGEVGNLLGEAFTIAFPESEVTDESEGKSE